MSAVCLFALLIGLVCSVAILRPGYASTTPKPTGLTLTKVTAVIPTTPKPADVPMADELLPTPEPQAIEDTDLAAPEPVHTYNGRPLRLVKSITMLTTAYSPDERSCGKWADGFTASGYSVWTNGMKLVAADTSVLPFGTLVTIPGYNGGRPVPVLDRGGKIKGNRLDLLYPTHDIALKWGAQRLTVDVWEYAD
ncbi:MAG: 3D domain-containing protein [Phycisphaerales bacterium]